jgi:hypothetical protein
MPFALRTLQDPVNPVNPWPRPGFRLRVLDYEIPANHNIHLKKRRCHTRAGLSKISREAMTSFVRVPMTGSTLCSDMPLTPVQKVCVCLCGSVANILFVFVLCAFAIALNATFLLTRECQVN